MEVRQVAQHLIDKRPIRSDRKNNIMETKLTFPKEGVRRYSSKNEDSLSNLFGQELCTLYVKVVTLIRHRV